MTYTHVVETISKVMCLGLLLFQGTVINKYLTMLYDIKWWCWIIADISVIILWMVCALIVNKWIHRKIKNDKSKNMGDEIIYTYIAWFFYVVLLCPRVVILFSHLAKTLDNADTFGPNFLKVSVASSPIIFFLLLHGTHTSKSFSIENLSLESIALVGALDLFDSIDLLEFLFLPEEGVKFPRGYGYASLVFFCISFLLPVFSLYGLQFNSTSDGPMSPITFKIIGVICNLVLLNIPNLVIRSVLWHVYRVDASVLLMKNVLGIIIGIYELMEYMSEHRPIRCRHCKNYVEKRDHSTHMDNCKNGGLALSPNMVNGEEIPNTSNVEC